MIDIVCHRKSLFYLKVKIDRMALSYPTMISNNLDVFLIRTSSFNIISKISKRVAIRFTDSIYTERLMGLPTPEDNLDGYNRTDISQRSEGIRGKKYMLIHGTGDDNVHYQQALALAKSLEYKDILFEQVTYTDEAHSLENVSPHLYHTMDKFWCECFGWGH